MKILFPGELGTKTEFNSVINLETDKMLDKSNKLKD